MLAPFGFTVPFSVAEVDVTEVAEPVVTVGGVTDVLITKCSILE